MGSDLLRFLTLVWYAFTALVSSVILFSVLVLVRLVAPRGTQRQTMHRTFCAAARLYFLFFPGWKIRRSVHENTAHSGVIYVTNHCSRYGLDFVILLSTFLDFRVISKPANFFLPFLGWSMWLADHLSIKRNDLRSIFTIHEESKQLLAAGDSLLIFPEGTRSKDGSLGDFKIGVFRLAVESGRPIIPVVLQGVTDIERGNMLGMNPTGAMTITIESPIYPTQPAEDLLVETRGVFMRRLGLS